MNSADDNAQFRGGAPSESSQPIRFAGSVLGAQRHVCAFFHSPDEEYRVLLPFIKEGFESGEKAFHIVDPKLRERPLTAVSLRRHRCGRGTTERPVRAAQLG